MTEIMAEYTYIEIKKRNKSTKEGCKRTKPMALSMKRKHDEWKKEIEYISLKSSMSILIKNEVTNNAKQKWITTLHSKMQMLTDHCTIQN
jgi:hypothetical protein